MDIVVTNAGRAALINAPNTGTAAVTITHVGFSNSAIVPTPAMTALAGEFKRIAGVAGEVVADDIIHVNATDASADAYELRSFALYLAHGTLFALYGQPAPILEKTASSIGPVDRRRLRGHRRRADHVRRHELHEPARDHGAAGRRGTGHRC